VKFFIDPSIKNRKIDRSRELRSSGEADNEIQLNIWTATVRVKYGGHGRERSATMQAATIWEGGVSGHGRVGSAATEGCHRRTGESQEGVVGIYMDEHIRTI
jgi:hypothetical protein